MISNPIKGHDHLLLVKGDTLIWKNLQKNSKEEPDFTKKESN